MILWALLLSGCGLVVVTIPLTVVVVVWTGRAQWNHDSWLLLPLFTGMAGVVLLVGAAVGALRMFG